MTHQEVTELRARYGLNTPPERKPEPVRGFNHGIAMGSLANWIFVQRYDGAPVEEDGDTGNPMHARWIDNFNDLPF